MRLVQLLDMRSSPCNCGLPVRDRPGVPPRLGRVFVEKLKSRKSKNAIKQVVVGEAETNDVVV